MSTHGYEPRSWAPKTAVESCDYQTTENKASSSCKNARDELSEDSSVFAKLREMRAAETEALRRMNFEHREMEATNTPSEAFGVLAQLRGFNTRMAKLEAMQGKAIKQPRTEGGAQKITKFESDVEAKTETEAATKDWKLGRYEQQVAEGLSRGEVAIICGILGIMFGVFWFFVLNGREKLAVYRSVRPLLKDDTYRSMIKETVEILAKNKAKEDEETGRCVARWEQEKVSVAREKLRKIMA